MTTTAAGPSIDLLLDINAAFNARDVDRILSFFDDDATFLMARGPEPNGRRVHGKAAIGKVLADRFKVISDMRWDHIEHFVAGMAGEGALLEAFADRRRARALRHLGDLDIADPDDRLVHRSLGGPCEAGREGTRSSWPRARERSRTVLEFAHG